MVSTVSFSADTDKVKEELKERPSATPTIPTRRTRGGSVAINKYEVNYGIPSRKSVHDFVVMEHGHDSWHTKIHDFLSQAWVEWTLLGLLCLDIFIIFTEMFLMTEYPTCRIIERDCLACCPYEKEADPQNRWLAESFCEAGYDVTGEPSCDSHKWEAVHHVETVLFSFTIAILLIFFTEICLEMAAMGISKFFKQVFLALDFVVVTVSLVFELVFYFQKSKLQEVFAILVVFRVWRFVRVGHAIIEVTSELTSKEYECIFEYIAECEKKLELNNVKLPEQSENVKALIEDHTGHSAH